MLLIAFVEFQLVLRIFDRQELVLFRLLEFRLEIFYNGFPFFILYQRFWILQIKFLVFLVPVKKTAYLIRCKVLKSWCSTISFELYCTKSLPGYLAPFAAWFQNPTQQTMQVSAMKNSPRWFLLFLLGR